MAAKLFGLFPSKGTIAPGADGDVVVFDPAKAQRLSVETHHSAVDYCLYEGIEVTGAVEHVLLRGEPVVVDGAPVAGAGPGRFVPRTRFSRQRAERLSPV
jgi:dihydropyrimidinase